MTITEALAELKTVGKRLEKKKEAVEAYLMRDARLKDPLEKEGGAVEFIKRERQAVSDLQERTIALRTAIQRVNLTATLTVEGHTRTVAEWLTWRREVAQWHGIFLQHMASGIKGIRDKALRDGRVVVQAGVAQDNDIIVHLDEKELHEKLELHEKILGDLDGKLSLMNATTQVAV